MSREIGLDTSKVLTSTDVPAFKLGTIFRREDDREYMYVEGNEALVAGNAVLIHEDFGAEQVDATSAAPGAGQGLRVALAVVAIESGGFGWVQISGVGDVSLNVATSCAAHTMLHATATAGRLDDALTAGLERIDGITCTAAESSNAAACILHHPRVGHTPVAEALP